MDLFVILNVATFKNILCIPIVCKYFIFVVSMEIGEKNQSHDVILFILGKMGIKLLFGNAGSNEENNCKPDHNRSDLLCQWLGKDK
jgi:hypothetical protein